MNTPHGHPVRISSEATLSRHIAWWKEFGTHEGKAGESRANDHWQP